MSSSGRSGSGPVHKDVEASLLVPGHRRRKPGEIPYPVVHSTHLLNLENWNLMFLRQCCRGLTLHQFDVPPQMVLDLGCGSGYWALEAATQWTSSIIVGYDNLDLQPSQPTLYALDRNKDLARRIKWVHGNLLDGLSFSSNHFDFVRIAGLGLAIPEDEWQHVLEEVHRVMKPGGILEIIEEDLIFPCSQFPTKARPVPINVELPLVSPISATRTSGFTSPTTGPGPLSSSPEENFDFSRTLKKKPTISQLRDIPTHTHRKRSLSSKSSFQSPSAMASNFMTEYDPDDENCRDHSKLKAAWDEMLHNRFICPELVTVLPFYLSSCFEDVQTHPTFHIPLPVNSGAEPPTPQSPTFEFSAYFRLSSITRKTGEPQKQISLVTNGRSPTMAKSVPRSISAMHLSKTVAMVQACKEAVWEEYSKLYASLADRVVRRPGKSDVYVSSESSVRDKFDEEWANWEHDMMDRVGLRNQLRQDLRWDEPEGDQPSYQQWRNHAEISSVQEILNPTPQTPCRSVRAFTARKQLTEPDL